MYYYLGQIGIFGFNFAPVNWAVCAGSILPISQNSALFSLLGTSYGGNGTSTFGLPDLRSRTPYGIGNQTVIGEMGGAEQVALQTTNLPQHNHLMQVNNSLAQEAGATQHVFAGAAHADAATPGYIAGSANVTLAAETISVAGGSQPHSNIQPYLTVNFCIATSGIFPPRS